MLISWTSPIGESGKSSAPSAPGVSSVTLASSFDDELSLDFDFYRETCPQAEAIVRSSMARIYSEHQDVSAALLRLFFHDCFIEVSGPFPSFLSLLLPVFFFLRCGFLCFLSAIPFLQNILGFIHFQYACAFIFTNFVMVLSVSFGAWFL